MTEGDGSDDKHQSDGLDLARDISRATAGSSATPARRTGSGTGGQRRTRSKANEVRLSGAHPDDRDPQLVDGAVSRLIGDRGWELELRMRGVFARWPELVGEEIAQHCRPETFVDGLLVVRTDSTAWATQLKLLTPQVLQRLNADLGPATVQILEIRGPNVGPRRGGRRTRDSRGPGDTYG